MQTPARRITRKELEDIVADKGSLTMLVNVLEAALYEPNNLESMKFEIKKALRDLDIPLGKVELVV